MIEIQKLETFIKGTVIILLRILQEDNTGGAFLDFYYKETPFIMNPRFHLLQVVLI